ncbi:diphosphomevalonate decarboxylase [Halobacteriovorax sp. BALOs_7]|uniref:diphosphomevalonate decarboxylase n=1 Tax=unclassified Halobacteriovorax TaxID=2639665 RepID=UPI000EA10370|nr:diphosphomevalonate decarboxylase [Halobacteriovorax sp. BALOs_7]AYF44468.1 diphosphomevalonate decarboxylase [Halobacteriovorax sp. BALOs_7]
MSTNFTLIDFDIDKLDNGLEFTVKSPSNIALIKYWGKYGEQLPSNPSLSVTLNNAYTQTTYKIQRSSEFELDFKFESKPNDKFKQRVEKFFKRAAVVFPFIENIKVEMDSHNSFPHSSGIASSAASMANFASALCEIEKVVTNEDHDEEYYLMKASFMARLGSGSASRSIYPKMAIWGKSVLGSSQDYAIVHDQFDEIFEGICDSIAIVSSKEKSVSSTAGHALMNEHPFAKTRFMNASNNFNKLLFALKTGDFNTFAKIVESEALELHGLMMNSDPSFILMEPNTLEIINRIREFRAQTNCAICFTLDAGPNVHIMYLKKDEKQAKEFIEQEVKSLCADSLVIHDHMGNGVIVER